MEAKLSMPKEKELPVKSQIQIKNGTTSKSFTVHGYDVDYLFNLFYMIMQKLIESPTDSIRMVCYKPPQNIKEAKWQQEMEMSNLKDTR